ncbi:STAS domain-containing protein [Halomonas halocynthiae]|uniref:STAS domain-containing protein n=1 Tax=Halomonas halocynthiae TaxID=176290 RepID=UPI0003F8D052|nr:STAS domain-containing protein [Halomonas halocynthiae]
MSVLLEAESSRLEVKGSALAVTGSVDFDGAAELASAGSEWLALQPASSCVAFDFGGVSRVSSAAISVMLEWLRKARVQHLTVQSVELSPSLQRLAEIAGLDSQLAALTEAASH